MSKTSERIRILEDGALEIIDPTFADLPLLRAVNPDYQIQTTLLPQFTTPRFLHLRQTGCGLHSSQLSSLTEAELWDLHNILIKKLKSTTIPKSCTHNEATLLDLKIEIAQRILKMCRLCAHRCSVDRSNGELWVCNLGTEAFIGECFTHIAEESPINPSFLVHLFGCALKCRFCQQHQYLRTYSNQAGKNIKQQIWSDFDTSGANSLSFAGGNPDESLPTILQFLKGAPTNWTLPIVWNCHGYASSETIDLLEGVVDVFVPDFKFGSTFCAIQLSSAPDYPEVAQIAIARMLTQNVPVIVRILVLPDHVECCHIPTIDSLANLPQNNMWLSIRNQYCPDYLINKDDGLLVRRANNKKVDTVTEYAKSVGLSVLE